MSHIISHKRKLLMLLVILGYSQVSFAMEAIDGDAAAAAAPTSPEKSPFVLGARKQNAEAGRKKKANPKVPRVDPRNVLEQKDIELSKELVSKVYQLPISDADVLTTEAKTNLDLAHAIRSGSRADLQAQKKALPADSPLRPIVDKMLNKRGRAKSDDPTLHTLSAQRHLDFGIPKEQVIAEGKQEATEKLQHDNLKSKAQIAKLEKEEAASKARIQLLEEEMKQLTASIGAKDALAKKAKEAQEKLEKLENEVTQLKANNANDNKKPTNGWYNDNKGLIGAGSFVTIGLVYLLLKHFKSKSTTKPAKAA